MKLKNTTKRKDGGRALPRLLARELTPEEIEQVSGGTGSYSSPHDSPVKELDDADG